MTAIQDRTENTIGTPDYTIGELSILNHTGDTRLQWDSRDQTSVDAARQMFATLRAGGHLIYRTEGSDGVKGEQISEFDPSVEHMVAMRAPVGG